MYQFSTSLEMEQSWILYSITNLDVPDSLQVQLHKNKGALWNILFD